jgi:uncharacterized alpha-E superfamily protein
MTQTLEFNFANDRPLLSRVADSVFWMSRYVERSEHVARILKVNTNLLMDVGDLAAVLQERQWLSVMRILAAGPPPDGTSRLGDRVCRALSLDKLHSASITHCIAQARENARAVRSEISNEMWEQINRNYWTLQADDAAARYDDQPEEFYNRVMLSSMLFQGLTDQTLTHDQRWMFAQLGKCFERIDITCRILDERLSELEAVESDLETPEWNIQWMGVLRMCCCIEAYRRQYMSNIDPLAISTFVILEDNFPRSIRSNVATALSAITGIRSSTSPTSLDPAEKILGKLLANLNYMEPAELAQLGPRTVLASIRREIADAAATVQQTYFLK